ncbi:1-phosphofructokinase family hexose kinase [Candidatus Auribacterota bacterium]
MKRTILIINLNPAWQKIYLLPELLLNKVNRIAKIIELPAGKGINTARTLKKLGEKTVVLGYAGGNIAKNFLHVLKKEKLKVVMITTAQDLRTCTTLINQKTKEITEITEPGAFVSSRAKQNLKKNFQRYIKKSSALLISGTIPQGEDQDIYERLLKEAHKIDRLTFLDSYSSYVKKALSTSPHIFKINRDELEAFSGKKLKSTAAIKKELLALQKHFSLTTIIITNGKKEIVALDNNSFYIIQPPTIALVNSVGSGDAFNAGYLSSYLTTKDVKKSLIQGVTCGAANAMSLTPGEIVLKNFRNLKAKLEARS